VDEEDDAWALEELAAPREEVPGAAAGDPDFKGLLRKIDETIAALGGAVFPKLNWSAPRDAVWATAGAAKCGTAGDIVLLLKSSEFAAHDLEHAYDGCADVAAGWS